jgi:hypothetical protein
VTALRAKLSAALRVSEEPWFVSALLWAAIACVFGMLWAAVA